jgi:cytochrome P450
MSTTTRAVQTAKFLGGMYRERARVVYWAHVRGDLFSRLILPNHHTDPYPIYEEMRALGPMLPTRLGNYSTTSHRLCNEVLRSRRFGVATEDGSDDLAKQAGLDLSLLELNPPDHTRIAARRTGLHAPPDGGLRGIG